jgi:hypothetical protein
MPNRAKPGALRIVQDTLDSGTPAGLYWGRGRRSGLPRIYCRTEEEDGHSTGLHSGATGGRLIPDRHIASGSLVAHLKQ